MKRFYVLSVTVLAVLGLSTGVAAAGQPANQACLGQTDSALATSQEFPGQFGQGVVSFAQPGGLGGGIQQLQAGFVPDEVVPNTCND